MARSRRNSASGTRLELPGGDGVFDHQLVRRIQLRMLALVQHPVDAFGGMPLHHQEGLVVRDAVVAGVQLGDDDDRDFQVAFGSVFAARSSISIGIRWRSAAGTWARTATWLAKGP